MTTPSTARKAGPLLGNGSTTAFPFTFKVFAAADVAVSVTNAEGTITVLTLGTDYTVTLNSNQDTSPGGTINYPVSGAALPTGSAIAIIGDLDYDQVLDLPSGGNFSPLALENQLDRATMQIQQLKELSDRSAKMSVFSSPEDVELLTSSIITLAAIDQEIVAVADNEANVNTVADNIGSVNAVAANITNVVAAGANTANINAAVANASNINAAVANATNINAAVANAANINAAVANAANINAVATNEPAIDTVAANIADVNTVADNVSLMNTVADNLSAWRDVTAGDDIQVTNFNGTGSQTAFTLPFSPGAENNTQVYISGVYQQKDRYTVSGTTLTFSTAPPSGTANIEVVWSRPFVLGATDSALVAYQPVSGPPTTAQTVLRSLQSGQFVSVKDPMFGAVGDGVADDTAAIQAAINSSNFVYIPPGVYKCSNSLTISQSNKTVQGVKGASILNFTTAGTDGVVFANNVSLGFVTLENLVLRSATPTGGKALKIDFSTNSRSNHVIRDVFMGWVGTGRWAYGLFANAFMSSEVYGLACYGGVNVCVHLENECNALRFYGLELGGDLLAERGIEIISGKNDVHFYGGTVQSYFSKSLIYVNGAVGPYVQTAYPRFTGFHLENITPNPSDGADVVLDNLSDVTFHNFEGGSFKIGQTYAFNVSLVQCGVGNVTILSGARNCVIFGGRASVSDNGRVTTLLGLSNTNNVVQRSVLPLVGAYNMGAISFSPGAGSGNGPTNSMMWTYQAPASGTWTRGDIAWNFTASAGGPPGWVCVSSGTPGTWKAMANLAA